MGIVLVLRKIYTYICIFHIKNSLFLKWFYIEFFIFLQIIIHPFLCLSKLNYWIWQFHNESNLKLNQQGNRNTHTEAGVQRNEQKNIKLVKSSLEDYSKITAKFAWNYARQSPCTGVRLMITLKLEFLVCSGTGNKVGQCIMNNKYKKHLCDSQLYLLNTLWNHF